MDTVTAAPPDRSIEAVVMLNVIEDRIGELLGYRRWYRAHPWTLDWPIRLENAAELRALVTLARKARGLARPAAERTDPMTLAAGYREWTEPERREAWGR